MLKHNYICKKVIHVPALYCTGSNLHRNDSFIGLIWGSSGITEYGNITNKPSSFTHLKRSFSVSVRNSCVSFEVITRNLCDVPLWRLSEWMLGDVLSVRLLRGPGRSAVRMSASNSEPAFPIPTPSARRPHPVPIPRRWPPRRRPTRRGVCPCRRRRPESGTLSRRRFQTQTRRLRGCGGGGGLGRPRGLRTFRRRWRPPLDLRRRFGWFIPI